MGPGIGKMTLKKLTPILRLHEFQEQKIAK